MRIRGRGAPSIAYLVVGLGNPGKRYAGTRHNIGLRVVEEVGARLGGSWRGRWHGRVCETREWDERVVVHDELDLPLGDVRAKSGGGLAGHNGLRSVVQSIGTQDFLRVRIGIGRPERGDPRPVADWVLQPFALGTDDDDLVQRGADCTLAVVRDGIDAAMRQFN